jgi:hypothetical protein
VAVISCVGARRQVEHVKELGDYRHNRFVIGTMAFLPLIFVDGAILWPRYVASILVPNLGIKLKRE